MPRRRSPASEKAAYREPVPKLTVAWLIGAWEQLVLALWPAGAVAGGFLAVALLDLLPALPGWLHLMVLLGFGGAFALALRHGLLRFRAPTWHEARRRLELDSGLPHRPLTGLMDRQAAPADEASAGLWELHQARMRETVKRLTVRGPRPLLAGLDPMCLRGLIALVIVIGLVGAGGHWQSPLGRALSPSLAGTGTVAEPSLDLFVTPPAYTGVAPFYLQAEAAGTAAGAATSSAAPAVAGGEDVATEAHGGEGATEAAAPEDAEQPAAASAAVEVPVNSTLMARVSGGPASPTLVVGSRSETFEGIEPDTFEIETEIVDGDRIAVEQGHATLGAWDIRVVPDRAPSILHAREPTATERAALRLEYQAGDDYGLERVSATLRLSRDAPPALDRTPLDLELTIPGIRPAEASAVSYHDLTPHPWAGQTVTVRLAATDGAGQTGQSEGLEVVLPEREFTHPVAKAIIEQRRTLMRHPDKHAEIAESLSTLSLRPDRFFDDTVVFLALRTASRRLALADEVRVTVDPVQRLLWDTALRIEDGDLSLAERELRLAQQALMEALSGDATDEEIERLMGELRSALDRYLDALRQNMMEQLARGELGEPVPVDPDRLMNQDQLQEMLEQMQRLAESGARDAARDMLAQLQSLLENLQSAPAMAQQQQQNNEAMELLDDLQNLMQAQQELLDQTFGQAQRQRFGEALPGQEPNGSPRAGQGRATQEALRRALGELMREMGEMTGDIPMPMGRAEQAMRQSEQALGEGQPSRAVGPQTEALDEMQQGMQTFVDQLMDQLAEQNGAPTGQPQPPMAGNRDPLGRPLPNSGGTNTSDVEIPAESELQRAREILDEVRRRLGESGRPPVERDYLERLLERF